MKRILFLLMLLLPLCVFARKNKNPKHFLPGRWIEIKRLKTDSTEVAIEDTIFMGFYPRDSFNYKAKGGKIFKGKYQFYEDNELEIAGQTFDVVVRRPGKLVFTNDSNIYYFAVDTLADSMAFIILDTTEKILPVKELDSLIGHWSIYKTTVDSDAIAVDYSLQVKSVYVTGQGSDDKKGFVYCGGDKSDAPSLYIQSLTPEQNLECVGKLPRSIHIVKCQKGELIMKENGVTYFFKQFR